MEPFWNFLEEPDPALFYRRDEAGDRRFGEIVGRGKGSYTGSTEVVILGFPYDEGTVRNGGRAGSAAGPNEVRRAFYRLTPTKSPALQDAGTAILDAGNIKTGLKLEDALSKLENVVSQISLDGKIPVVIGGSNDLSYADARALKKSKGEIGAINVDSHLDVRDYSKGINSGTPYRMLLDEKTVDGSKFAEYAVQEFVNSRQHLSYVQDAGAQIFSLNRIRSLKNCEAFMQAYRGVSEEVGNVYVSFDIDSVRSSDAPGVSASVPTGLTSEEILECAYLAGSEEKTALVDICEYNPKYDLDGRTARLAAMVMANFLSGISNRK